VCFQQRCQYQVVGLGVLHAAAGGELHRCRAGDFQRSGKVRRYTGVALAHPAVIHPVVVLADAGAVVEEITHVDRLPCNRQARHVAAGRRIQIHLALIDQLHHQRAGQQLGHRLRGEDGLDGGRGMGSGITFTAGALVEQIIRPTGLTDPEVLVRPAKKQVDDLLHEIRHRIDQGERVLVTTLTKRMAEELTEYYLELGIKTRYLHSDIETLKRSEIIRDLRRGIFDVLIGINLLREGLDIPEVSLVAIMDADKEGFLRSERSLIQTIGRAARNVHGQVIMYCDAMTQSLKKAIDETSRRRETQKRYNEENNITPETIVKSIHDLLQSVYEADYVTIPLAAEETEEYVPLKDIPKIIKRLKKEMRREAARYNFEKAAQLRDRIFQLEAKELELRL